MAITTLDGLLAGMQPPREVIKSATPTLVAGRPHSLFYLPGIPGAAVAPTPGMSGEALTTYAGQLPFSNPASGMTYLARLAAAATIPGQLILCDRLWHNSGINVTLPNGNCNNDTAVDLGDFDILASAFGTSSGDAGFDVRADLDGSLTVDLGDFDILSESFAMEDE
jgi:hypothetical protein